ncbi:MAG: arginine--tRNA ligase [Planctomycetota bacterium]|nr:MAG: arginine--tRNA ligase [Planctomycetota bacterium]RLS93023.1 MAG: arginine--tRNA ligase [Planctomycetota bacterium]
MFLKRFAASPSECAQPQYSLGMVMRARFIGCAAFDTIRAPMSADPTATLNAARPTHDPATELEVRFMRAIEKVTGTAATAQVRASTNAKFGDFQMNAAMALAKESKSNPRALAQQILDATDLSGVATMCEVAGPGFVNVTLETAFIAQCMDALCASETLGIPPATDTHAVVIDLCGVNVAKQMHVGHLRATIIGDSLARVFERLGRTVRRENHLGDWGLPIAMTLAKLLREKADFARLTLDDLNRVYRGAQQETNIDDLTAAIANHCGPHRIIELEIQYEPARAAMDNAKKTLIRLQSGDVEIVRLWERIIAVTMDQVYDAARVLNVKLSADNNRGESFFRDSLAGVIDAFAKSGLARIDKGAMVVPFADRERPLLIQKSDGGFLYATTDLAAVRFRTSELDGSLVVYVVDARQRDHFKDVFDAARMIGWNRTKDGGESQLVHLGFGAVLGADKKPLKTRSGENFTLKDLLDEACDRGTAEVTRRAADPSAPTHGLSPAQLSAIGCAVGIAAVKYADLSGDLTKDYVFDLDAMIAFEGDTGPYLQYAHARIASILAKSGESDAVIGSATIPLAEPAERALALHLLRYAQMVMDVGRTLETNRVGAYLAQLASSFNSFYQSCPVLKADDAALRLGRLRLCALTRVVLADGLSLYGIIAPERM